MKDKLFAGIDIGGTTAKIGLVDPAGNIIVKTQIETDKSGKWQNLIDNFILPIENWQKEGKNIIGVGIGAPGAFDQNKRALATCVNIPILKEVPFIQYIEDKLKVPVIGDNDATCAAVGEHIFGSGRHYKNFIMITVGTGIGGGIIINDKVYRGRDGYAGELGHIMAVPDGLLCSCGNRGCIETYASATAIINQIKTGIEKGTITSYKNISTDQINAELIFHKAKEGDFDSISAIDNAAKHLGDVIGSFINLLNLDAIIIGGGVAQAGNYFIDKISSYAKQTAWKIFFEEIAILPAKLLNDAGIIGAASLILEEER